MREIENNWMIDHKEEMKQYVGQWVVIEGEEVISSDINPFDAVVEAKNKGVKIPYIIFIDSDDPGTVKMGL